MNIDSNEHRLVSYPHCPFSHASDVPHRCGIKPLLVVGILLLDALGARGRALLIEVSAHGAMEFLFKDGLRLNRLELGLEVLSDMSARVATATWIRHAEGRVVEFIAWKAPIVPEWSVVSLVR
jgi:hypothetical protein